jgi:hypothetical protein
MRRFLEPGEQPSSDGGAQEKRARAARTAP